MRSEYTYKICTTYMSNVLLVKSNESCISTLYKLPCERIVKEIPFVVGKLQLIVLFFKLHFSCSHKLEFSNAF